MDNLEEKAERYSRCISPRKVSDAFKVYYETKDFRIREQLIYRYMPLAKKHILNLGITSVEEEDLEQMAYEKLICSIDSYNPNWLTPFSSYLHSRISQFCKMNNIENEQEIISMSDIDIYSNDSLEDIIIEKKAMGELVNKLKELLRKHPNDKLIEVFKNIYGIDCNEVKVQDIARKGNISLQAISEKKNKVLLYLFLTLTEEYKYYPSETIKNMIVNHSAGWFYRLSKEKKKKIDNLDLDSMDHFIFYHSYDSLEDSHKVLKRK